MAGGEGGGALAVARVGLDPGDGGGDVAWTAGVDADAELLDPAAVPDLVEELRAR